MSFFKRLLNPMNMLKNANPLYALKGGKNKRGAVRGAVRGGAVNNVPPQPGLTSRGRGQGLLQSFSPVIAAAKKAKMSADDSLM